MLRINNLQLPLTHKPIDLVEAIAGKLNVPADLIDHWVIYKRSYDARNKRDIKLIYQIDVRLVTGEVAELAACERPGIVRSPDTRYHMIHEPVSGFPGKHQTRPVVVGFGPCGMLAALLLAQMGFRPIVLERGREVRQRTKDTWAFWRERKLNPESNVQFGEGGAGTFSDGKLYSQVKDPKFRGRKVLTEFVKAGAPEEILFVNKPHIGTFKLVKMVESIRAEIIRLGGEIRFESRVDQVLRHEGAVRGLLLSNGEHLEADRVILAVGHSARDTFQSLLNSGVYIEPKPFSIGLRIEHPQSLIDQARFGVHAGNPILGAADYKLVHHCRNGRSVYSFCMCPGGTVVAASSEAGRVVTNGMSQYSRNERNANAAIVVGITPEVDFPGDVLAGIDLQVRLEEMAYKLGGANYNAPAQLLGDFLADTDSLHESSVKPSYRPGITLVNLARLLPEFAVEALREAIPAFAKKVTGFAMADALLTGVETRTSSPICIKRDRSYQSLGTHGLYPAGEGAGYAGGILSAGIDGIKVAEAVALDILGQRGSGEAADFTAVGAIDSW